MGSRDFTLPLLSRGVPLERARGPHRTSPTPQRLSGIVTGTTLPAPVACRLSPKERAYQLKACSKPRLPRAKPHAGVCCVAGIHACRLPR